MFFDKHNCCNDIAHRALMLFMDDKNLKRRLIFKVNKSLSEYFCASPVFLKYSYFD